jgi:4-hydroxy-4-methyl-2-oxoglutarate aldolase
MPVDYAIAREKLYAAIIADILDEMGFPGQVMDASIRPLQAESLVVGRARTVLAVPEFSVPARPYDKQIEATDALEPGDIMVAHMSQITACAFWGELFSTAAVMRGAVGAVIDGYVRDVRRLTQMNFPVFAAGVRSTNSKGRATVAACDVPIRCGGVLVHPSDVVFAEIDGVVVIPEKIAPEVMDRAIEAASRENLVRSDLLAGSTLRAAWEAHHAL